MDLSKLTQSDKAIAGSGIVLFIASFLPWFKVSAFGFTATGSGWDVGFLWAGLPALLGLAAAGAVLGSKLGNVKLPELPVPWGQAYLIAGGVSAALVVLKLLIGEDFADRAWGLFLATLAALGLLAGGFLASKEQGGSAGSPPPPPPF